MKVFAYPIPGSEVISVNCEPSAIPPDVCAGQEPAGLNGVKRPKGIVPCPPTAVPPTNTFGLTPSNWHWNSPLSSEFRGAVWQYGTDCEVGELRGC